jgi:hypothetical protein
MDEAGTAITRHLMAIAHLSCAVQEDADLDITKLKRAVERCRTEKVKAVADYENHEATHFTAGLSSSAQG